MTVYPKIQSVEPLQRKRLRVTFSTGVNKVYDCTSLLAEASFSPLKDEWLFKKARPDPAGYGVVWNDDIDLSESELWLHGEPEPTG